MTCILTQLSQQRLDKLHPDIARLVRAVAKISPHQFSVSQGLRTREEQFALWRESHNLDGSDIPGAPWKTDKNGTLEGEITPEGARGTGLSNHQDGMAIDLAVIVDGHPVWDEEYYIRLSHLFYEQAEKLGIKIRWGGDFPRRKDRVHWELNRAFY